MTLDDVEGLSELGQQSQGWFSWALRKQWANRMLLVLCLLITRFRQQYADKVAGRHKETCAMEKNDDKQMM